MDRRPIQDRCASPAHRSREAISLLSDRRMPAMWRPGREAYPPRRQRIDRSGGCLRDRTLRPVALGCRDAYGPGRTRALQRPDPAGLRPQLSQPSC
ncbi:MAG: hypothetical protein UU40_C0006G0013 [Candidatus Uhrbacteria bacterium GW2011_GWD2_41_121]|uniref:Uncharacterized protein n=1 Tax=Candidatus Uhrbacteria bacterium GW2011_GWC1_41_20 TaxID=1618983 RepID=A0A0G0YFZ3_9BACT|nr:MAG: hypothetical protein UT52_C0009G0013 [Candidatus Uhrbacteria bacterium GW2011_GWE1_39_46]KKR63970.1 MAG: hypothetical protein UU04_C0008G0013 [Candidatus Uhrbacteria bacterium GW2011_GWC2_40_450]KKR90229.1 MAG: hypothetical protein UU40_C0006G0013 [Candidatus Uhrbacteria bacterium GW2011_GWD2_41_121]KKR95543.1 MAG: hypothetical protein UU46_C0021G0013 [Candidatus Uhrbacteria bacterium GW2011_GWD1_41_16]KKR99257.1 MAG: hypothetical protein UU50_C0008G0013 [Candidatus Uhrbacteria bacteriu